MCQHSGSFFFFWLSQKKLFMCRKLESFPVDFFPFILRSNLNKHLYCCTKHACSNLFEMLDDICLLLLHGLTLL